ncbi:MAG: hypothetical protein KAW51_04220 [Candidatus Lokiarchaeota archaeon]|nr:hypothetical protein [Candidatus Lokiarchaeota archaeon]
MNEKELFSDYEPKTTPDTAHDYLRNPDSFVFEIMEEIGQPSLEKLKIIIDYFIKYKTKAEHNPGDYQEGNIAMGADPDQYYPSEEEILVSELGKMIKIVIDSNLKKVVDKFKKREGINSQTLIFNEIYFRHVDVMGSGRFFYAEKKKSEIELRI